MADATADLGSVGELVERLRSEARDGSVYDAWAHALFEEAATTLSTLLEELAGEREARMEVAASGMELLADKNSLWAEVEHERSLREAAERERDEIKAMRIAETEGWTTVEWKLFAKAAQDRRDEARAALAAAERRVERLEGALRVGYNALATIAASKAPRAVGNTATRAMMHIDLGFPEVRPALAGEEEVKP